ncbi:MAG: hypothetical protein NTV00_12065 [Methylococcales bacterium]|nr:hypothetical protein [Methylococcales bacterium]
MQDLTPAFPLSNIHHDSATLQEIQDALNVGKEVITHTDAVSVPGWTGAGYIIIDPDTGSEAYKIASGANGAWFSLVAHSASSLSMLKWQTYGATALQNYVCL